MKIWKREPDPQTRIFLYFQDHPDKFFTVGHVGAQVRVGIRAAAKIIDYLEALGKLEGVDTVSSKFWGRPRRMYRATRPGDNLKQHELTLVDNGARTFRASA